MQLARLSSLSTLSTATRDRHGNSRPVSTTSIIVTCEDDDEVRAPPKRISLRELQLAHVPDRYSRSDLALASPISDTATLIGGDSYGYKNTAKEGDSYDHYAFTHNLDRSDTMISDNYIEMDMQEVKIL